MVTADIDCGDVAIELCDDTPITNKQVITRNKDVCTRCEARRQQRRQQSDDRSSVQEDNPEGL